MNDRNLLILILLVVVLLVGGLIYRATRPDAPVEVFMPEQVETEKRSTAVRATMTSCLRVGEKIEVKGVVHNLGSTSLDSVTVQSIWKDKQGNVIDTGIVYAVTDSAPLAPGEKREFTDTTRLRSVGRCNVRALDWWASGS